MRPSRAPGDEPIPGYRLIDRLGQGGFGEVWKCDAPGGLVKAVKFVRGGTESGQGESNADKELRSLELIKTISHPYLLSIERIETLADGDLAIVSELAECSLHDLLTRYREGGQPGLPRAEAVAYLAEAAEVLDMMNQEHGLQHLDIKPRNLFLVRKHVKVADFGLVSSMKDLIGDGKQALGAVTPLYASPEIFDGRVTNFSDQFSLAASYHELITGSVPFKGRSLCEQIILVTTTQPDLSKLIEADQEIVARALHKEPEQRFPSCTAFLDALMAVNPPGSGRFLRTRTTSFEFDLNTMPAQQQQPGSGSGYTSGGSKSGGSGQFARPSPSSPSSSAVPRPAGPFPFDPLGTPPAAGARPTSRSSERPGLAPAVAAVASRMETSGGYGAAPAGEVLPGIQLQECLHRAAGGELWRASNAQGEGKWVRFVVTTGTDANFADQAVAQLLAMDHPILAEMEALPAGPGRLALVSEAGEASLAGRLRECQSQGHPGVPRRELLKRIGDVALALDELYESYQVQHLALSPRHLAISRGDSILCEFGLAELLWVPRGLSMAEMNYRYAAAELFHGLVSPAADQYSLALIYAELLTGVPPFRNLNARQMAPMRSRGNPDLSMLPGPERMVLLKALSAEPERRFGSCQEMFLALQQAAPAGDRVAETTSLAQTAAPAPSLVLPAVKPSKVAGSSPSRADLAGGWRPGLERLVEKASQGQEVRTTGNLQYRVAPGQCIEHRCRARLAQGVGALKLGGFRERWQAAVVSSTAARTVMELRGVTTFWGSVMGRKPGLLMEVLFGSPRDDDLTPIRATIRPTDVGQAKAVEMLAELGSGLLVSLQSYLGSQSSRADQERFPLSQGVVLQTGSRGELTGQLRDIGRFGMSIYTQQSLPHGPVTVVLGVKTLAGAAEETIHVPGRVRDCVECEERRYEVEVTLDGA